MRPVRNMTSGGACNFAPRGFARATRRLCAAPGLRQVARPTGHGTPHGLSGLLAGVALAVAMSAGLAGCKAPPPPGARPRIVSFSPALTGMVFELGLGDHVVGVTTYCRLPAGQRRAVVGDRLHVSTEAILAVQPDVLLVQQAEGDFKGVTDVRPSVRVEPFRIETLEDVASAAERIGRIAGQEQTGKASADNFRAALRQVRELSAGRQERPRVLFVIGHERPMVAGPGTFVAEMIELAGGVNAGADVKGQQAWRNTGIEGILLSRPDVIICQAELSAREAARKFYLALEDAPAARTGQVHVVTDGRWTIPGLHLPDFARQFADIIHGPPGSRTPSTRPDQPVAAGAHRPEDRDG